MTGEEILWEQLRTKLPSGPPKWLGSACTVQRSVTKLLQTLLRTTFVESATVYGGAFSLVTINDLDSVYGKGAGWSNCGGTKIQEASTPPQRRNWRPKGKDGGQELLVGKHITALVFLSKCFPHVVLKRLPCIPLQACGGRRDAEQGTCEIASRSLCALWPGNPRTRLSGIPLL